MGELSTSINDALLAVDLNTVELVKLQSRQKQNRERNASGYLAAPSQSAFIKSLKSGSVR